MSKTLSSSQNTSPHPPVRLSDNAPIVPDVPSSPSPEPEAITRPQYALQADIKKTVKANGWSQGLSTETEPIHSLSDDGPFLDSAAATPRLPPSKHGSDDLQAMPSHELGMLDDSTAASVASLPHSLPTQNALPPPLPPSPPTSKGSLVTSFSEVNLNSSNNSSAVLQHRLQSSDKGFNGGRVAPSPRPWKFSSIKNIDSTLYPVRARSQGAMSDTNILKAYEEEANKQFQDAEVRERPQQQVEDAGSEEKRNRSSSRSGRVEKRIEATLAKAEPSSTARSRKSSHLLGLFKENATQDSRRSIEKVPSQGSSDLGSEEHRPKEFVPKYGAEGTAPQDYTLNRINQENIPQAEKPNKQEQEQQYTGRQDKPNEEAYAKHDHSLIRDDDFRKTILPDLLSEIRHHKLAIPSGNRLEPCKPQLPQAGSPSAPTKDPTDASNDFQPRAVKGHVRPESTSEGEGDEDSDKEEISSALYYPHEAPSADGFDDIKDTRAASANKAGQKESGPRVDLEHTADEADETPTNEVDIALQSQNKQRYLHGDLPRTNVPPDDVSASDSGLLLASESEYESFDDSGRSTSGDEGNLTADSETTPRASPGATPSSLRSRSRRRFVRPAAPFGAVELRPYTHQVGGHNTVYKFSKRAVCKPLSNRENEFYEVIEHQHPELLKFLPRYESFFKIDAMNIREARLKTCLLFLNSTSMMQDHR